MSIIFKLKYKSKSKFCKITDGTTTYADMIEIAKNKFNIVSDNLSFTDLDGTIVEEDCIFDVLRMSSTELKIITHMDEQDSELNSSSNSTLSVSEITPNHDEVAMWLENVPQLEPHNDIQDTSNLFYENNLPSTSDSRTVLSVINIDKDGFAIPSQPTLINNNIRGEVLQLYLQNNGGQHILEEYKKYGILSDRTRRDLVNLTVKVMVQNYGRHLSKKIKTDFAKAIVELFPKLKDSSSTKGGYEIFYDDSKRTPSGYLAWRLRTVVRTSGLENKRKNIALNEGEPVEKKVYIDNDTDARDIEFLKNANSKTQREEIFQKMKNTINVRKYKDFTLDEFPRFLDTPGLICQDFSLLYPNSQVFQSNFEKYIQTILKVYTATSCQTSTNIDGTSSIPGWDKPTRAIFAVIHMLPSTAKGKKTGRRDSYESSVSRLIIHCTPGEPLQNIASQRKGYQPYLIAIGSSKAAVHDYKVVVDNIILDTSCNKFTDAFDFLFKTYFVFKIKYENSLEVFYNFVQVFFYQIPLDQRFVTTKMRELINRLENYEELP